MKAVLLDCSLCLRLSQMLPSSLEEHSIPHHQQHLPEWTDALALALVNIACQNLFWSCLGLLTRMKAMAEA